MKAFDIGLSALRAQQQTLSVLGNNLANAATPGYHRQRVELADRTPTRDGQLLIGSGVDVTSISRLRSNAIEAALLRNASETAASSKTLEIAKQVESFLTPGEASMHAALSQFFNQLEKVSNSPQDMTTRQEFLSSASSLMNSLNSFSSQMNSLTTQVQQDVNAGVREVNKLISDISDLNGQISSLRVTGREANDLMDRRDQLLTSLSEWVGADLVTQSDGREIVVLGGGVAAFGSTPITLQARRDESGSVSLVVAPSSQAMKLNTGKLHAMTKSLNETLPEFQGRLQELARQIVRAVDDQHAKGMSDQGPYTLLLGTRGVKDVDAPLAKSQPEFPISSGDLFITITENATGVRSTKRVSIDVQTDSLTDVAARLSGLPGVMATVDTVRKTLLISAEGGYSFDFAGRPDNIPDLSSMTGTARPEVSGLYLGGVNDTWDVTFSGAGTVGVTPGLTATVRNASGQVIAVRNVGAGYEAGTDIDVRDGISLSFASGSLAATDTFSLKVTGETDEPGLLSALGINSLFQGSEMGSLAVRSDLLQDPRRLAISVTGMPGDALNFAAIAGLRDLRSNALNGRTFVEELADLTAESGLSVVDAENQMTQLQAFSDRLTADRDAVSGVDINEEMLQMMQTQRAYQAAARYLSTTDQMIEELLQLVR
jgi:flagellar hook-associated protein FlgK